jgi:hypothetical protein
LPRGVCSFRRVVVALRTLRRRVVERAAETRDDGRTLRTRGGAVELRGDLVHLGGCGGAIEERPDESGEHRILGHL